LWIDSHCHLNHERNEGASPDEIILQAGQEGVDGMLNISCQIKGDFPDVLETARHYDNVWCSVGTHPHDAGNPDEQNLSEEDLVALALSDENIIGIGESGLDYYYDNSPRDAQQESFRKHIRACMAADLPLIVHARDADEDIIRIIMEEKGSGDLKGVMHCFSSGRRMAEDALELGFYISFSGIITFKKAEELRGIARNVPPERLLVETDAPYLAPEPHRGKTNMPAYVGHTGSQLAAIHDMSPEEMARQTTDNFFTLFAKAERPA